MVASPLITAVGRGLTFIVLVPVRSALIEVQRESDKVATLYVVVAVGDTLTLIGLVAPLNDVPSLNVPLHGPRPVTVILMDVEPPLQIVADPLTVAVGRGLTVTTAEPVNCVAVEVSVASIKVATV